MQSKIKKKLLLIQICSDNKDLNKLTAARKNTTIQITDQEYGQRLRGVKQLTMLGRTWCELTQRAQSSTARHAADRENDPV